jgi:hypothetical protein
MRLYALPKSAFVRSKPTWKTFLKGFMFVGCAVCDFQSTECFITIEEIEKKVKRGEMAMCMGKGVGEPKGPF